MPSSALTTYRSHYFKFYVGRSWVGGYALHRVNIHQEATYVCIGGYQLWNNSVLPSPSPEGLPCDKAEMEVGCRSEWGCNYFLTSLSASKPSHSALQLMRCPCGIVMLSKWMPLWQPGALWAAHYCRVSPNNAHPLKLQRHSLSDLYDPAAPGHSLQNGRPQARQDSPKSCSGTTLLYHKIGCNESSPLWQVTCAW